MNVDFSKTAADYARFRPPFAVQLYDRLARFGIGEVSQRVLDVGAGTGLLGVELHRRGCTVTCVDPSAALLAADTTADCRLVARAEALPFRGDYFDVVTAAQCWHWFDRHYAPREIFRVLRPAGVIAVIYQTYIPLPGSLSQRTEQLILKHRPRWRHANSTGLNGQVMRDLQSRDFSGIESFSFDVALPFTREAWRGYIRTTSAVGASMSQAELLRFDAEHEILLRDEPERIAIPHRVFTVIARKPVASV